MTVCVLEHLRIGCDLMNAFFLFDEYTDCRDPDEVQAVVDIVKDALRDPYKRRPVGENIIGEVWRQ